MPNVNLWLCKPEWLNAFVQPNGQVFWRSLGITTGEKAEDIVRSLPITHSIHLNSGTHGDIEGFSAADHPRSAATRFAVSAAVTCGRRSERVGREKAVSFTTIDEGNKPRYPENANHVIDEWCYSSRNRFVSTREHMNYLDFSGEQLPVEYKCVSSNKIMDNPHYFEGCDSVDGRAHHYDLSSIKELQREFGETGEIHCRYTGCKKNIHLDRAVEQKDLKDEIASFKQKRTALKTERAALKATTSEQATTIERLTTEGAQKDANIAQKDATIGRLEGETALKDRTITDLTAEKDTLKQQRDAARREKAQLVGITDDRNAAIRAERTTRIRLEKELKTEKTKTRIQAQTIDGLVFENRVIASGPEGIEKYDHIKQLKSTEQQKTKEIDTFKKDVSSSKAQQSEKLLTEISLKADLEKKNSRGVYAIIASPLLVLTGPVGWVIGGGVYSAGAGYLIANEQQALKTIKESEEEREKISKTLEDKTSSIEGMERERESLKAEIQTRGRSLERFLNRSRSRLVTPDSAYGDGVFQHGSIRLSSPIKV